MKAIITLFILLTAGLAQAELRVGTYTGKAENGESYKLHIRSIPEREGSFLALLVMNKDYHTTAFVMDAFSASRYGLSAINPKSNYIMGPISNTPNAVLSVTDKRFVISNNPGEKVSLPETISFKLSSHSSLRWKELDPGNYGGKSVIVSSLDANNEASVSVTGSNAGEFVLRESRPALYISLRSELTSTGIKTNKKVNSYVYFLKVRMGRDKMVTIDGWTGEATVTKHDIF